MPARMHRYSDVIVAMVCHDANMAMTKAQEAMKVQGTGAIPGGPFIHLHEDLLDAAIEGVRRARRVGQPLSPRDHHNEWVAFLTARGWTHGERDPERRRHPNLVPWDELTPEEQDKDRVFMSVVFALSAEGMVA